MALRVESLESASDNYLYIPYGTPRIPDRVVKKTLAYLAQYEEGDDITFALDTIEGVISEAHSTYILETAKWEEAKFFNSYFQGVIIAGYVAINHFLPLQRNLSLSAKEIGRHKDKASEIFWDQKMADASWIVEVMKNPTENLDSAFGCWITKLHFSAPILASHIEEVVECRLEHRNLRKSFLRGIYDGIEPFLKPLFVCQN